MHNDDHRELSNYLRLNAKPDDSDRLVANFWSKVRKADKAQCWLWTASLSSDYGCFRYGSAHRFSYLLFHGPIPAGLVVDHLCFVKSCVNPYHLEAVTTRENTLRAFRHPSLAGRSGQAIRRERLLREAEARKLDLDLLRQSPRG
jgi:hypothetical protein